MKELLTSEPSPILPLRRFLDKVQAGLIFSSGLGCYDYVYLTLYNIFKVFKGSIQIVTKFLLGHRHHAGLPYSTASNTVLPVAYRKQPGLSLLHSPQFLLIIPQSVSSIRAFSFGLPGSSTNPLVTAPPPPLFLNPAAKVS